MANIYLSIELANLKQEIIDVINKNPLSYCLKRVVVDEIAAAIKDAARQEYEHDLAESEKEKEKEKAEESKEPVAEG